MQLKGLSLVALTACAVAGLVNLRPAVSHEEVAEHLTPSYKVEGLYPSMKGPAYTNQDIYLSEGEPELLWVRGYEAVMVGSDGQAPKPQQFMCHNTLSIHRGLDQHRWLFGSAPYGTRRLFTLSQGQYRVEFPPGFGIPVLSTEKLMLQSQVLNLNQDAVGEQVRHKIRTHFVRDAQLARPLKPLCMIPSGVSVKVTDQCARKMPNDPMQLGCGIDPDTAEDASGGPLAKTPQGTFTGHWVVRPGSEVRKTNIGWVFPFDTTIHYICVHVHPGAEKFELRDLTTQQTLFVAKGEQLTQGIGLDRISYYSSEKGIPVFHDHQYELVSHYRNQTQDLQSAMAFMFFYVLDQQFHRPDRQTMLRSDESFCGPARPDMLR
jgi:hypothetical protein